VSFQKYLQIIIESADMHAVLYYDPYTIVLLGPGVA